MATMTESQREDWLAEIRRALDDEGDVPSGGALMALRYANGQALRTLRGIIGEATDAAKPAS